MNMKEPQTTVKKITLQPVLFSNFKLLKMMEQAAFTQYQIITSGEISLLLQWESYELYKNTSLIFNLHILY